jgi:hypothetical protein
MAAMDRRLTLAVVRGASALLVFFAIGYQAVTLASGAGGFSPTRFFAFFTILSNLFGASLFLYLALRWRAPRSATLDVMRGASVVYLTVTFLVHKVFPVIVVLDWLVDPPAVPITLRHIGWWFAYPIVWVSLTLIRGAADGWYPYPFLNPANGGYGSVAFYFVAILIGFFVISAATMAIGNVLGGRRPRLEPAA